MRHVVLGVVLVGLVIGVSVGVNRSFAPAVVESSTGLDGDREPIVNQVAFAESLGIRMAPIRSGEFLMGSTKDQVELAKKQSPKFPPVLFTAEQARHRVRITQLAAMSAHEITVGQFAKFVAATGYTTDAERDGEGGFGYDAETGEFLQDPKYGWKDPGFPQTDNHPVVNVTWDDAAAFTKWLSAKEGAEYRLPTDAEWEYCCRAGSVTQFSFGDDPEELVKHGNILDLSGAKATDNALGDALAGDDGQVFSAPVGSYRANGLGLYDMHGNVMEWCLDSKMVSQFAQTLPTDPVYSSEGADFRVYRSGSWYAPAGYARSAFRSCLAPKTRSFNLGFRVVQVRSVSFAESLGIRMIPIRSGEFLMGSSKEQVDKAKKQFPKYEPELFESEQTQHRVKITKLAAMSEYEITVGQFAMFVAATGYKTDAEKDGKGGYGYVPEKERISQDPKFVWNKPSLPQTDDHPVVNVSWNDAVAFTKWLSAKDGVEYRLPTEAEWEYCCRAGSVTQFSFGDDPEEMVKYGNVWDASGAKDGENPLGDPLAADDRHTYGGIVGFYQANAFGLYDMHGNVWEWCLDGKEDLKYNKAFAIDPVFPPEGAARHAYRGGGWLFPVGFARSAVRGGGASDSRNHVLGFRIAQVRSGN